MKKLLIALSTIVIITSCSNQNNSETTVETKKVVTKSHLEILKDFKTDKKTELDNWVQKMDSMLLTIQTATIVTSEKEAKLDTFLNEPIHPKNNILQFLLNDYLPQPIDSSTHIMYLNNTFSLYYFAKTDIEVFINERKLKDTTQQRYVNNEIIPNFKRDLEAQKNLKLIVFHKISNYDYQGARVGYGHFHPSSLILTSYFFDSKSLKLLYSIRNEIKNSNELYTNYGREFEDINNDLIKNLTNKVSTMLKNRFILQNDSFDLRRLIYLSFNKEEAYKRIEALNKKFKEESLNAKVK